MANANQNSNYLHYSDQELWTAFKEGDRAAFTFIYKSHLNELFNYGMKIIPDRSFLGDCIQELFIDLWKHKNNLSVTDNIKYYLFKAFRRLLIKEIGKQRKNTHLSIGELGDTNIVINPVDKQIIADEMSAERKTKLKSALTQIPLRQQEVLNLLYYQNYTYEQISHIMGINIKSVYTLAWKAFASLKKILKEIS